MPTAQQKAAEILQRREAGESDADIIVSNDKLVAGFKWLKDNEGKMPEEPAATVATLDRPKKVGRPVGSGSPPDSFEPSFGQG